MNQPVRELSFLAMVWALAPRFGVPASVEKQLNVLEQRRYDALIGKDWQALGQVPSDKFFLQHTGGASMTETLLWI